jgi:hypothetical protein
LVWGSMAHVVSTVAGWKHLCQEFALDFPTTCPEV